MAKKTKRDQILATAGKLFMEKGFQAVSVDEIAAAVPVSKPTLYANFEDKRDLFMAVISERCERALVSLRAGIAEGKNPQASLENFAHHFLDLLLSGQSLQLYRVITGESTHFPEMAKMFYETGPKRTHALLADYLTALHKKGVLKIPDPSLAADIFLGMLKGRMHLKCMLHVGNAVTPSERKKLVKTAVAIFVNGQKP